jgi:hypothetical protein
MSATETQSRGKNLLILSAHRSTNFEYECRVAGLLAGKTTGGTLRLIGHFLLSLPKTVELER